MSEDLNHLFDTLRHLTEALESGDLSVEESVRVFVESKIVEARVRAVLDDADRRVTEAERA